MSDSHTYVNDGRSHCQVLVFCEDEFHENFLIYVQEDGRFYFKFIPGGDGSYGLFQNFS